jgi:hypothetical protein
MTFRSPGYGGTLATLPGSWADITFPFTNRHRATAMRAEIQGIVDEIRQSVGLLRRHL